MNKTKETFVFGFALFAGFFGAGNLILPPLLGFKAGGDWWLVTLGFIISATIIPLLAILAHARLQGTMLDFGKKVSPFFSLIFCLCMYAITIALPCPRTAAVAHEMAIASYFGTGALLTSVLYFALAFVFVMNRNKVLSILGKYLTPIIVLIVLAIIVVGVFSSEIQLSSSNLELPLISGLLEGYQTYDAMAGMIMGGIVLVSINNSKANMTFGEKKKMVAKSGFIAIIGLFVIYAGLIAVGAIYNTQFDVNISRTDLLSGLATKTLGSIGSAFLAVLVALSCFTTAVAIIVSVADFFKEYFKKSKMAYLITTIICCVVGVLVGQMNVKYIIDVAIPALMFIYPICIVLILLNVLPEKFASKLVFRAVVLITFVFSIPDFLGFIIPADYLENIKSVIPLASQNLGWILPALIAFILVNLFERFKS
ncbi:branched-chain amino acid transport system II carrier protein [Flaviramulus sp. BrNp1-15]|uniref:branched-chain amino acid transport system II carrier protein n=1 Tax=Flaviramulus sp. BrNp1-15 TaxID=2916754 RepID=UPI001EE91D58|nr:branched-chain amino acid transport system II carrier protein [Flaviramulus sp. BrNp1-15]ULC59966.1 branched-chain amino acid transport system II carrier protein [Flaviramulus sp. BrNp1-15]